MNNQTKSSTFEAEPTLVIVLGWYSIVGCLVFALSILVADFVVPNHDWIADTISDLGAGEFEYIVDIGIYAFSGSLISIALLAAHIHMGGQGWSFGTIGLALLGLIVFLVGARNEYGDSDSDGVVIHIYLVYALGLLMAIIPWLMSDGAACAGRHYGKVLVGISVVWAFSAPVFFFLPDGIDGVYERYLGLIAFAFVFVLASLFIRCGERLNT
ncbi:DUF998 domain-containing protein [Phaeobacter piscinae]|uniref:DUF998 domain-containing protein n=1 Tax=Phaeobacter piscinae TaxID=1580596 RepID=UPI000BBE47E6|nr:DUF998 domain-containing protein [Phaeobacter piscinae]ATG38277.1 hypothetical protein PhaeoP14_00144 [Phaeobacter piscinae]